MNPDKAVMIFIGLRITLPSLGIVHLFVAEWLRGRK